MKTSLSALALASSLALLLSTPAHAEKDARPLATDKRVRQVPYDPNQVYNLTGTYGYQVSIEFGTDEVIKLVALGDSIAWQPFSFQNQLYLKPVEANASTNLTVQTSKRKYLFNLKSSDPSGDVIFAYRFIYPSENNQWAITMMQGAGEAGSAAYTTTTSSLQPKRCEIPQPVVANEDYSSAGDKDAMGLKRVFDDGQFTYFEFRDDVDKPTINMVGTDGAESNVNWRRECNYLVVERLANKFNIINGKQTLCVANNTKPIKRVEEEKFTTNGRLPRKN
ncbi:TrbG/VirB9 family P-type conjugative transfer protein [Chromobacterium vaccinii]|uniref:TrbG/VirB9 family P-type conjugative transfer protein n=1 Tax=Chromobacterium vaccinii TaxID=1108595 RepID=UPI00345A3D1C